MTSVASGKKNYFRHSMNAFEDDKIQCAIDKLGYAGYAYYFILLELLARQCETECKNPIRIHQQSLRNVWRKHTKSCVKVIEKLQESGLFVATFKESYIEFDIPNLSKYLGRYEPKKSPNGSKERKGKKRKEKESKLPLGEYAYFPDDVIQLWNDTMTYKFPYCRGLGSGEHLNNFIESTQHMKTLQDWVELFELCKGLEEYEKWNVNLNWLVNYDNALKVFNGNFKPKFRGLTEEDVNG